MEVKSGYKQTDVGVIPENWNIRKLRECLATAPDYGINAPAVSYSDTLPAYIRITDITEGGRFSLESPVSVNRADASSYYLDEGDLVFARTGASVGKSYLYNRKDGKLVFAGFLIRVRPDASKLISAYLAAYVTTGSYWNWVRQTSMRSGQPGINGSEYGQLPIPLPQEIDEQRAIAGALTDVDALIGSLEQLIAKKHDLKQAAMQQLLAGQTRLPGFTGEWGVKILGELGSTFGGLTGKIKSDFGDGTARYITFMNIMSNVVIDCGTFERVKFSQGESQNRVMKGDLFFNGSSETPEEVAMCSVLTADVHDVFLNSFCFGFRFRDGAEADGIFLAYYFRSREGRELMKSLAQGSTRYNLSKTAFLKASFCLPSLTEQTAIAGVLTDMDAELTALEQRLAKTRDLKQGMMQELLTGRTRLV